MPYHVEIICLGKDNYSRVEPIIRKFNQVQSEVTFAFPPYHLRDWLFKYDIDKYKDDETFGWIGEYKKETRRRLDCVIGIIPTSLDSPSRKWTGVFGSASDNVALISFENVEYADTETKYVAYYLLRYVLKFFSPKNVTHDETKNCFFDAKIYKPDLAHSLNSLRICDDCMRIMADNLDSEKQKTIGKLKEVVEDDDYPKVMSENNQPKILVPSLFVSVPLCVLFAIGSVFLYLHLIQSGSQFFAQSYYLALVLLGFGVGTGLFFSVQSFMTISGTLFGLSVQAGGPTAVMILIIILGFNFSPPPSPSSELTVKIEFKSKKETPDLRTAISNVRLRMGDGTVFHSTAGVNDENVLTFEKVQSRYSGKLAQISFKSDQIDLETPDSAYVLKTDTLMVIPVKNILFEFTFHFMPNKKYPIDSLRVSCRELAMENVRPKNRILTHLASIHNVVHYSLIVHYAGKEIQLKRSRFAIQDGKSHQLILQ